MFVREASEQGNDVADNSLAGKNILQIGINLRKLSAVNPISSDKNKISTETVNKFRVEI